MSEEQFTPEELSLYDGSGEKPACVAVNGIDGVSAEDSWDLNSLIRDFAMVRFNFSGYLEVSRICYAKNFLEGQKNSSPSYFRDKFCLHSI